MFSKKQVFAASLLAATSTYSFASPGHNHDASDAIDSQTHAPIGVMGEHTHKAGEWMISFRSSVMTMKGTRIGTDRISTVEVTNQPNRFAPPAGLRVVPTEMTMQMQMLGVMWAPSDRVTLMLMAPWIRKYMTHTTFAMGSGTNVRGEFTTEAEGWGDISFGGLFPISTKGHGKLTAGMSFSAPTGSVEETDQILRPDGATPSPRLPYSMQLGSGSWAAKPSVTYACNCSTWGWGVQYNAMIPLEDNDEGYQFGDIHRLTGWISKAFGPQVSIALRAEFEHEDQIAGIDSQIAAPVQTADPDNYGGTRWYTGASVNYAGQKGWMRGHRLALEVGGWPLQNLHGPQLERDLRVMGGYQYAF